MKKIKYLCLLLVFTMFVPKVYAFTYDLDVKVDSTIVSEGATKEIKVSVKNVQGVSGGFGACSLNIELDDTIELNGSVKAANDWSLMVGNIYAFDTSSAFVSGNEMFTIPVKINRMGNVKLTNIKCSDGESNEVIADKSIKFQVEYPQDEPDGAGGAYEDEPEVKDNEEEIISSANLSSITLSEGTIDFDPNVTEYDVVVTDFNNFDVFIRLESSSSSYSIDKNDNGTDKNVVITVTASDGTIKTYTINVTENANSSEIEDNDNNEEKQNNNYAPIFIGIICVLVLINVFRIVKNSKK